MNNYQKKLNLRDKMLKGKKEKNERFINIVNGLESLFIETVKMDNFLSEVAEPSHLELEHWLCVGEHETVSPHNDGKDYIAHYKAKESIFTDLVELKSKGKQLTTKNLQDIVHKWDMWHYS